MEELRVMEDFKYGQRKYWEMRSLAEDSMKYLKGSIGDIKESYLTLGRHLHEFKRNEYYKDFGYDSFDECIKENLSMDKGSISKCLNVWEKFAEGAEIKEEYKGYNYSQLVEMVSMDNPEVITPDMTIKEIRKKKKELKQNPGDEKKEQKEQAKPKASIISQCKTREDLIRMITVQLVSIGDFFSNVYCTLLDQPEDSRSVYINVREDSKGLEPGKYKLVLQKIKEK